MSDSENYETTFNHFFLHFLRYLCNFCPNTCSQEAILMKVSHLGVVTLLLFMKVFFSFEMMYGKDYYGKLQNLCQKNRLGSPRLVFGKLWKTVLKLLHAMVNVLCKLPMSLKS
jgi:hypothetical protein